MKKIALLMFCILALIAMPLVSGDIVASSLDVTLSEQSPSPAEPGVNMELDVYIENDGYGEAAEVVVEIMPKYPFALVQGDKVKKFTRIGSSSSVKTTYTLFVNESALTNTYDLEFRVYSNRSPSSVVTKNIPVSVQGEPKLIITDVTVSPETIEPGSIVDIRAKIKNVGTGRARHLELGLNSSSAYLVPVLSGGSAYLEELGPGDERIFDFRMSIDVSSEYKTYMTSITMDYKDEDNADSRVIFDMGVPVRGTVNLDIINIEASLERGRLRIEVANKGTSEAKSLEAKLVMGGETLGIDYLTNLKANKQTTFDFPLVYTGTGQLVIDYIGPGIEKNQVREDIVLDFSEPEAGDGSGIGLAVIVIIIIVVAYLAFRRMRKKKR